MNEGGRLVIYESILEIIKITIAPTGNNAAHGLVGVIHSLHDCLRALANNEWKPRKRCHLNVATPVGVLLAEPSWG